jgi:hypothetical protein
MSRLFVRDRPVREDFKEEVHGPHCPTREMSDRQV